MLEEGAACVVQRRSRQTAHCQSESGEGHAGIAIVVHDKVESAPRSDVQKGFMALFRQPGFGVECQTPPELDQGADVYVAIAEQRDRVGMIAVRAAKASLEFEGFPLDRLSQGSLVDGQSGEIAPAIRGDSGPKVRSGPGRGRLLRDVIDQVGDPRRGMSRCQILKGSSEAADGPAGAARPSGAERAHVGGPARTGITHHKD